MVEAPLNEMSQRSRSRAWGTVIVIAALQLGCNGGASEAMTELQRVNAGGLDVIVLSPHDALQRGKDAFVLEFRSNGHLVDVGGVRATANMPMPGMAMFGSADVRPTEIAGRYAASSEFEMAGTWRMTVEWVGPAGQGSVTFSSVVQ